MNAVKSKEEIIKELGDILDSFPEPLPVEVCSGIEISYSPWFKTKQANDRLVCVNKVLAKDLCVDNLCFMLHRLKQKAEEINTRLLEIKKSKINEVERLILKERGWSEKQINEINWNKA